MNARAQQIGRRFGAALESYDGAARIQAHAAGLLASSLAASIAEPPRHILEFGCGTGLFTAHLRRIWPMAHDVVTDLAWPLTRHCRARHGGAGVTMDAERACFREGVFDLVCGNLAAQWFAAPESTFRALQRLVRPGGAVALTTLGPATLEEWRIARIGAGLEPGGLRYLPLDDCAAIREPGFNVVATGREIRHDAIRDARSFLRGLTSIGADHDPRGRGDSAAGLRRAMRLLDQGATAITYEILTVIWRRESA